MRILYLNIVSPVSFVRLYDQQKKVAEQTWVTEKNVGSDLLKRLDDFLSQQNLDLKTLTHIAVHPGPGSFTSARLSVTVANTLAWSLNIPVVTAPDETALFKEAAQSGVHFDHGVMPFYDRPPSVTLRETSR